MPRMLPRGLSSVVLLGCASAALVPAPSSRALLNPAWSALRPRGAKMSAAVQLEDIKAAPPPALTPFSLAEAVSIQGFPELPWRYALRNLVTDETFLEQGWARRPFKLKQEWEFAVNAYTMGDVERDVSMLPAQFVAHGMQWGNGIYNKPMDAGFSFEDVSRTMSGATVVMLNAGFIVPSLAKVSLATLEATRLPIWLNVYLTRPGLASSTQLHTDKQDVLVVQTTGRKRWRVYAPPEPAEAAELDPFARGKGTDQMDASKLKLLVDTVMAPGQVLYIPAAFPHETDTVGEAVSEKESSVHLTIGAGLGAAARGAPGKSLRRRPRELSAARPMELAAFTSPSRICSCALLVAPLPRRRRPERRACGEGALRGHLRRAGPAHGRGGADTMGLGRRCVGRRACVGRHQAHARAPPRRARAADAHVPARGAQRATLLARSRGRAGGALRRHGRARPEHVAARRLGPRRRGAPDAHGRRRLASRQLAGASSEEWRLRCCCCPNQKSEGRQEEEQGAVEIQEEGFRWRRRA